MSTPFQQPSAGGDKVPVAELVGSLVLIYVRDYRQGITTVHGEKDAVACDVHVLDGPKGGEIFDNALLFQAALIGSLKPASGGDPVLARVGVGIGKPGQNPPFVLNPFTDADAQVAMGYIQRMPKPFQPAAAAPAAPAAASAATAPAAANPAPPAAAPAGLPNGMTAAAFAALPLEVQELIRQSVPA